MIELYPKQEQLRDALSEVDVILYGGARGGGKSFSSAFFCALDVAEYYSETEAEELNIDISSYRSDVDEEGITYFYKFLIDYPDYQGVMVRRTKPQLIANTKVECDKIYPLYGGVWVESRDRYEFPKGSFIYLRHCKDEGDLDWFQGPGFYRLHVEELTQFEESYIEKMESCVRAPTGHPIRERYVYTANPGNRGHAWVYKRYVKPCLPVPDGEPVYVEEYDYTYQPLKPGKDKIIKFGRATRKVRHIPALVWDNPHLSGKDSKYIINLMNKSTVLRKMWLDGDWSVKAGDFFDQWDDDVHVIDAYDFFEANSAYELNVNRKKYKWDNYTLLLSFDYGFRAPGGWACGFYAIDKSTDEILKVEDWLEADMGSILQARFIKREMMERYGLDATKDIDYLIGDPQNFWTRKEKGISLVTFADEYADEGLILMKGINDRKSGANKMWDAHSWRKKENRKPKLRFLTTAENSIDSFPFLPRDSKDPEMVDTKSNDHNYDENRYMISIWTSGAIAGVDSEKKEKDWRDKLKATEEERNGVSWRVA